MAERDYKMSLTFKGDGAFAHPWLVLKGDTAEELQGLLSQAHEQDLFTAAGRAHKAFERGVAMGGQLDATTIKAETAKPAAKAKPEAAAKAEPKAEAEPEPAPEAPAVPKGAPKPAWKK